MELAEQRGELIARELVLRQAAFLLTAMRSRCMSAPSAWARRLVNISDPREMTELLRAMMTNLLEELAGDSIGGESGAPLRQDDGGPTGVNEKGQDLTGCCSKGRYFRRIAAVA